MTSKSHKALCALFLLFPALALGGDPIPGIDITVNQSPGGVIGSGITNSAGEFTIDNLDAGDYLITLSGNGHSIIVGQTRDDRITIRNTREAVRPLRVELSQYQGGDILVRKRPGRTTYNPASESASAARAVSSDTGQATSERRRVVVLKSNKQGDPNANRYDFANNNMDQDCDGDTDLETCNRALDDDSDGDTILDGAEMAAGIGHLDEDSDDDGLETATASADALATAPAGDNCSGVAEITTSGSSLTVTLTCDDNG